MSQVKSADENSKNFNLKLIQEKLSSATGKQYWRSLEELADTEEFQQFLHHEFPQSPFDMGKGFGRRKFLKLMGASMALAGLSACTRQPLEKIFPYVDAPEEIIPGKPLYFATAMTLGGYATGVLVESHMGRPTKVEGNPEHPASLGATDIFAQASVLELYDPDRAQVVTNVGRISTWPQFLNALTAELQSQKFADGAGIRILTETVTSPTLAEQLKAFLSQYPLARWHQYEPVNRDNAKIGSRLAFGEIVDTQYDFSKADVILSLDADFLYGHPGSLKYARQFAARRKVENGNPEMNRLYMAESSPTITGSMADHRLGLKASQVPVLTAAIADALGALQSQQIRLDNPELIGSFLEQQALSGLELSQWIKAVAKDLQAQRGRSLVVAGEQQPPVVHQLAHVMNSALGNIGSTITYTQPVEASPVIHGDSIHELVQDMQADSVGMLIVVGGNPVFDAPADLNFAENMGRVRFRVHLNLYEDETSELCHWHIPQKHYLESWSDARAFDGTASIIQPLIAPFYQGKSAHELLAALTGQGGSDYDIVRAYWQKQVATGNFEKWWRTSVHDGFIAGTAFTAKQVNLRIEDRRLRIERPHASSASDAGDLEITFRPDPHIRDGRFVNNGWLQELPKPLTKLTWDNAALLSPATAEKHDLKNGDVVQLTYRERTVQAPVWITPGQPDGSVAVNFGYGRRRAGKIGVGLGFNAYALRTSDAFWFGSGLSIQKTDKYYKLASTQMHHSMEGRHLVRHATLEEFIHNPDLIHEMGHKPPEHETLYPEYPYEGNSWGMVIDLNSCIGCNGCTVACQAENNIPVVGKEEVLMGREMHWIRVDRYYEGGLENPDVYHQPVPCMHCDNAPCEVVCPVAATVHGPEGLNEMIYNRCVGTRYCSNNCPYKVRRFNFYRYALKDEPKLKLLQNPDVTVRSRGVMEKCTYCVQRINAARIEAKKEGRQISDGEVLTACQQVCPTDAIIFGNLNDPESRVAKLKKDARNYGILEELNTYPRTTYLAKLKNPNPELEQT